MTLIVSGCIAPMLIALAVWMWADRSLADRRRPARGEHRARGAEGVGLTALPGASLWEGLTDEIARRDTRRHPRRSAPATRARHLAAVLPADARR